MNRRQRRFQQRLARARARRVERIPTPLPLALRRQQAAPPKSTVSADAIALGVGAVVGLAALVAWACS